jgi:hypothetical protein
MDQLPAEVVARRPHDPERLLEFSPYPLRTPDPDVRVSNLWLWFGALGGAISWALHLMFVYFLVEVACSFQTMLPLYGASVVLGATAIAAGLVSWRYMRAMRHHTAATTSRRVQFMGFAGVAGAMLFLILIVGGTLPMFFDDPCQLQGRRRPTLIPFL